jgi:hypothetical protein
VRSARLAPPAAALFAVLAIVFAILGIACTDTALRAIAPGTALTDPAGAAALLPPSIVVALPADSVMVGDTLGGVTATAMDFGGKVQHNAAISWSAHAVDAAPGVVTIMPVNPKAQQITLKGITRGRLELVASYTDRFGQVARDSAAFHVAPRTATIGICLLDPHVADSLGIHGDTTVDYGIVGPFCLHNDTLVVAHPTPTPGLDTTKAPPPSADVLRVGGFSLLDARKVRVHVLRADRR